MFDGIHRVGTRLSATLDLDGYGGAVARNPYLTDYAQRFAAGHYDALVFVPFALDVCQPPHRWCLLP